MSDRGKEITELSREELLQLLGVYLGDVLIHYGMWFTETVHNHGISAALQHENDVIRKYFPILMNRLAPHLGIEMSNNIPKVLLSKSREELILMLGDISKTWLAGDGLWFQSLEGEFGMPQAKIVNDTCWSHFAHLEAFKLKKLLGLSGKGGLSVLEKALKLRIYSTINAHSMTWEDDKNLLFRMTECRVQSARRRKQMDDYPCKSAGIIEYTEFATAVDPAVKTQCVWCPPDRVPVNEFCAWRFTID